MLVLATIIVGLRHGTMSMSPTVWSEAHTVSDEYENQRFEFHYFLMNGIEKQLSHELLPLLSFNLKSGLPIIDCIPHQVKLHEVLHRWGDFMVEKPAARFRGCSKIRCLGFLSSCYRGTIIHWVRLENCTKVLNIHCNHFV